MTLALLLTAVTGAWADETLLLTIESKDYKDFTSGSMTFDDKVTITFSKPVTNSGNSRGWYADPTASLMTVAGTNGYNITSCKFYTEMGTASTGYTVEGESPSVYLFAKTVYTDNNKSVSIGERGIMAIEVYGAAASASTVDVTTNKAEEGATFTEASFTMPAFDATAEYELVRDMSVQMTATMGDGTDGVRYRVKKNEQNPGKYEPADMNMMQVLALVAVNDGIEHKTLTLDQDYFCRIYKLDEQTLQPEGDGVELYDFDFAPGLYALKAFAKDGSNYDGETALSNTFQLFQGYEVTVPAGEYATFYKDENLYTEDDDAELYTISSVTESEAVLSDAITVAPANTPLLVYNKSEESKTFLLIPTTDKTPDNVTAATQFVGTLEATTIPASATGADNYALNGYAFVWVKNAIEVGANKCWLHIASQPAAARAMTRSIVGGNGTTGIDAIENVTIDNEGWYDMQGRKLQAKPNRSGIYIYNGKKVVVRK